MDLIERAEAMRLILEPTGSWSAYHGPYHYAMSGTFCHLMHVLHTRNFQ